MLKPHLITLTIAACINIALHHLFPPDHFDLLLSGPNYGRNAGTASSLSSGTMGAALEGSILGLKSIALSFAYDSKSNIEDIEVVKRAIVASTSLIIKLASLWPDMSSSPQLFNINVPLIDSGYEGIVVTEFHEGGYTSLFKQHQVVQGQFIFGPTFGILEPLEGTDMWAIMNRRISVTPMNARYAVHGVDFSNMQRQLDALIG